MESLTQLIKVDEHANDKAVKSALEAADRTQKLKEEVMRRLQEKEIEAQLPDVNPEVKDDSSKIIEATIGALKDVKPEAIGPYLDEIVNKYLGVDVKNESKIPSVALVGQKSLDFQVDALLAKARVYSREKDHFYDKTTIKDIRELAKSRAVDSGDAERYISLVKRVDSMLEHALDKEGFAILRGFNYFIGISLGCAVVGSVIGTVIGAGYYGTKEAIELGIMGLLSGIAPGMIIWKIIEKSTPNSDHKKFLRKYLQDNCKTLNQDMLLAELYGRRLRSQLENPMVSEDCKDRLEDIECKRNDVMRYLSSAMETLNKIKTAAPSQNRPLIGTPGYY